MPTARPVKASSDNSGGEALWQELEQRLLPHWEARWGRVPTDRRMQLLAVLLQRGATSPLQAEDMRALGPLLCQSPEMQKDFRLWLQSPASGWPDHGATAGAEGNPPVAVGKGPEQEEQPKILWPWLLALLLTVCLILSWVIWPEFYTNKNQAPPAISPVEEKQAVDTAPVVLGKYDEPIIQSVALAARDLTPAFLEGELPQLQVIQDDRRWVFAALLGALAFAGWRLLAGRALRQGQSRMPLHKQWLGSVRTQVPHSPPLLPDPGPERLAAMQFKPQASTDIDIRATVESRAQQGVLQLHYGARQRRRSFVLILPSLRPDDWRHGYLSDLSEQLADFGVELHRYHYRRSPTQVFAVEQPTKGLGLDQLPQREASVIAVVDRAAVWHREAGQQLQWLDALERFDDHLLLFDEGLGEQRGAALHARGVSALSLSSADELQQLFDWMADPAPSVAAGQAIPRLPESLKQTAEPAFAAYPPDDDTQRAVVHWLKAQLPEQAFDLLCAALVFPNPEWRLVWCLAQRLPRDALTRDCWPHSADALGGGSLNMLRPLVQLPWSRQRLYPLWLRVRLVDELDPRMERQVAHLYHTLLKEGQHEGASAVPLSIDLPQHSWRNWLAALRQQGPLRDALFASAYTRSRLAQRLPRWLRRRLRQGQVAHGELWPAAMAAVLGLLITGAGSYVLWEGVGEEASQEARLAARFAANQEQSVIIEHRSALSAEASWLRAALQAHGYPVAEPIEDDSANDGINTLQAPVAQVSTLARLSRSALYDNEFQSTVGSDGIARIALRQSIRSGGVFRDALLGADKQILIPAEGLPQVAAQLPAPIISAAQLKESGIPLPIMLPIPAGTFLMGSPTDEADRRDNEGPQHEVAVPAFELAETETTWGQWAACEAAGECVVLDRPTWHAALPEDEKGQHPVVNVSWDDAQKYITWLNSLGNSGTYRLPTEAEWEYAARAGSTTRFYTGDCIHTDQANYDGNYDSGECGAKTDVYLERTVPVQALDAANDWKLRHMAGNVHEWTEDCWYGNYDGAPIDGSEWVPSDLANCDGRVLRGGSWGIKPRILRSAFRFNFTAGYRSGSVGFRLARTP